MKRAWLFSISESYSDAIAQEKQLQKFCTDNAIEEVGATMEFGSYHPVYTASAVKNAFTRAAEKHCDYFLIAKENSIKMTCEVFSFLLESYFESGISLYSLDKGNVTEAIVGKIKSRLYSE